MEKDRWRDWKLEGIDKESIPILSKIVSKEVPRWGILKAKYPHTAIKEMVIRNLLDLSCEDSLEISLLVAFNVACMSPSMMKDFMENLRMFKKVRSICDDYKKNGT